MGTFNLLEIIRKPNSHSCVNSCDLYVTQIIINMIIRKSEDFIILQSYFTVVCCLCWVLYCTVLYCTVLYCRLLSVPNSIICEILIMSLRRSSATILVRTLPNFWRKSDGAVLLLCILYTSTIMTDYT